MTEQRTKDPKLPRHIRTIRVWAAYDSRTREIMDLEKYKKNLVRRDGHVIVELRGTYARK